MKPRWERSCCIFLFSLCSYHRDLHSFPTRRSSDLLSCRLGGEGGVHETFNSRNAAVPTNGCQCSDSGCRRRDRKSTRLNSSHMSISYAVFCLKKKMVIIRQI